MIGSKLWVVNIRRFGTPLKGLGVTGRTVFKGCLNSIWKAIYLIKFEALTPRDGSQVQRCNLAPIFLFQIFAQTRSGSTLGSTLGSTFLQNLGLHFNIKKTLSKRGNIHIRLRFCSKMYG